jgi:aspartate racemase
MKTIGLIGGMSWESSAEYYRILNETVQQRLGRVHSADCIMLSFDFAEIEVLQMAGDWDAATQRMIDAAQRLEHAGAACIVVCTNTMHLMADAMSTAISIPLLHIADPTAEAVKQQGLTTIGLLGTAFTMERDFYRGRLSDKFGLDVLIPESDERKIVHDIIYQELVRGIIRDESRIAYQQVIASLIARGAQGIILGCTEIGLLIQPQHSAVPVFDTTRLHALAAADFALAGLETEAVSQA